MRLGWGARQVLALLLLALILIVTSVGLQLHSVLRQAIEGATTESMLISQAILHQIGSAVERSPADPLAGIEQDRGIDNILRAATARAPSVVFVAVCDSEGVARAHTTQSLVGTRIGYLPPLPHTNTLAQTLGLLPELLDAPVVYDYSTPLQLGTSRFATIRIGIAGVLLRERVMEVFRRGIIAGWIELMLAIGLGFALSQLTTRRFREIEAGVTALRQGQFDRRIRETGLDEFGRLARDLNLLSEQFQKEQADRDSRLGSFRRTVELLGEGVLTLDPDRRVVLINNPTGRLLGVDTAQAWGKSIDQLLPASHPVRRLGERLFEEDLTTLTIRLPRPEGETPYVAIGHRIRGEEGAGGVLIEFKETAALEAFHALVDQSRILSRLAQMAAGVAHEIRNPLQTINLELSTLQQYRNLSPREIDDHLTTAMDEIQRLQRAVSGFLKVARLRQPSYQPAQVNELLEELHSSMEAEANLAGIELELDLEGSVPETFVDREVLRQAVENIVRNAIQALPSRDGRVCLGSRAVDGEVRISVSDSGPGIPKEIRGKVTDLYFSTKDGGTGVGLALVTQAVEMHGGQLSIDSEPGEGTMVTLRLPLRSLSGLDA